MATPKKKTTATTSTPSRAKKPLKVSKEPLRDLAPAARRAPQVKGGSTGGTKYGGTQY